MITRMATGLLLTCTALSAAAGEWSLHLKAWQSQDFELPGAPARETERRAFGAAWHTEGNRSRTGISYEHQPLLIRAGNPATNGYLHRVDLEHEGKAGATRYDLALGVHGSSNIFTHGEFREEALVGRFKVLYPLPGAFDAVGLAGDYRFGQFLVYPRLTTTFRANDTEVIMDLPVRLAWRDPGQRWNMALERYGERWATLDTTETVEGKLYLSEWQLTGRYRIWRSGDTRLDIGAGVSFDTEARYLDLERGRVEGELDSALFTFIEFSR
jgi:hypothetical protein